MEQREDMWTLKRRTELWGTSEMRGNEDEKNTLKETEKNLSNRYLSGKSAE